MKASDHLFCLIKSLTKSEKRYFKVINSRKNEAEKESNYMKLFDAIDEQEVYDEEKIIEKFAGQTFIKHLPSERNYLYFSLLKVLVLFHENSIEFMELEEIRHYASVLYNKGLYDQSNKMLGKARKWALTYELFPELLSIAKLQLELLPMIAPSAEELKNGFNTILKDEQLAHEMLDNINQYTQLYSQFLFLIRTNGEYIRTDKEKKQFEEIMNNTFLLNEEKALCYRSKEMYFFMTSAYLFLYGDLDNAYKKGEAGLLFLSDNLGKLTSKVIYSARVSNHCEVCLRMGKFDECEQLLQKLWNIETISVLEKSKNFYRYYDLQLRLYVARGGF